jgi:hypothetical protein
MVNLEKKIFPNYAYKSLLLNLNLKFKLLPCCSDGKMFFFFVVGFWTWLADKLSFHP